MSILTKKGGVGDLTEPDEKVEHVEHIPDQASSSAVLPNYRTWRSTSIISAFTVSTMMFLCRQYRLIVVERCGAEEVYVRYRATLRYRVRERLRLQPGHIVTGERELASVRIPALTSERSV